MRHAVTTAFRSLARAATAALVLAAAASPSGAASGPGPTISHKPIKYFVPGKRIRLEAVVKDPDGVSVVRCYFRAMGRGDFVFTTMEGGADDRYRALLPAPVATTTAIQYRIQTVGKKGRSAKTTTYTVERREESSTPVWQDVATDEIVRLGEGGTSAPPDGFGDALTKSAKPSSPSSLDSSAKSSASAKSTGLSKGAWLGIGAGAAAVGGGALLLAGGGGGEDEGVPCDSAFDARGNDEPVTQVVNLGKKSGTFSFRFEMFSQKDRMLVLYEGQTLFDTGCRSNGETRMLSYGGGSRNVTVQVLPNCAGGSGTAWNFTVGCP